MSSGEIIMAMESARDVESIYQPVYEKDGDELLMVDQLCEKEENGRDEPEKEAVLNRMVIEQLMERWMSGNRISSGAVILKTGHRVKRQKNWE